MSDASGRVRRLGESVSWGTLSALWGLKVSGLERVPRAGPLLVACNHASLADPPALCGGIAPARSPWFLAKRELFDNPLLGRFFRAGGVIPLERKKADLGAMRAALDVLRGGGSVAIFPEGTRVRPGETREPKTGVAFLSAHSGARVLPARLLGTDRFPFAFPLELRFGEPLAPAEPGTPPREYARRVMDAVYSL